MAEAYYINMYKRWKTGNIGYISDGQAFSWQQKWQPSGNGLATCWVKVGFGAACRRAATITLAFSHLSERLTRPGQILRFHLRVIAR